MSVQVLTTVMRESQSELGTRLVAFAIADSAHDDGITWVGQEVLCAKTRLSERQVRRAIDALVALGELTVRRVQRGRLRINLYQLNYEGLDDPDFARMPAEIAAALRPDNMTGRETGAENGRPDISDVDDRTFSTVPARAHVRKTLNRKRTVREEANASSLGAPPKLVKVNGRNVALDVLCEVTGVDPDGPRLKHAIAALNGSGTTKGIRDLFWIEAERWAEEHERPDALVQLRGRFEDALSAAIRVKAEKYQREMPGAVLTPTALRSWWLDLERRPASGRGLTPDEIEAMA